MTCEWRAKTTSKQPTRYFHREGNSTMIKKRRWSVVSPCVPVLTCVTDLHDIAICRTTSESCKLLFPLKVTKGLWTTQLLSLRKCVYWWVTFWRGVEVVLIQFDCSALLDRRKILIWNRHGLPPPTGNCPRCHFLHSPQSCQRWHTGQPCGNSIYLRGWVLTFCQLV